MSTRDLLLALLALLREAHARRARGRGYGVVVLRSVLLGLLLALAFAPAALADGDPASDVLQPPSVRVYMTNGATDSQLEQGLQRTAQQISDAGLPIKVAVIGNTTDLGAVPQLWAKPRVYAKFLGAELRYVFKDTLLVVMPQGLGVSGPYVTSPNTDARAVAALAGIDPRTDSSPKGLTAAADRALRALADADGKTPGNASAGGGGGLPLPLIAAGVMVLAGIGGGVLIARGDRTTRRR